MMFRKISIWPKILVILIVLWVGAFLSYIHEISDPSYSNVQNADGIVVLTGTPARLSEGFELLKSGAGRRILISGVNRQVSKETLRKAMGESARVMDCCVDIGHIARDTVGNAYEASLWAAENKFNSLIIVTSAYHMPRSLVEMKRQMPSKPLFALAAKNDVLKLKNWWLNPSVSYVLAAEFNKYIFSLIRANLERLAMDGDTK
ncbi:MAG: YdcF family protein [Sneathiella sp.]